MSYTNHTTNYNLPQYVGTDKPTYLGDFNTAMGAIDTQMKANADAATTAGTTATAASNAIGALANLTTTDKTSIVNAINEVDTNADTAQTTASTAGTAAATADAKATQALNGLNRFNLTSVNNLTPTTNKGSVATQTYMRFATDSTSSVYKLYGRLQVTGLSNQTGNVNITAGSTSLRPTTSYTVEGGCLMFRKFTDGQSDVIPRNFTVGTDGTVTVQEFSAVTGLDYVSFYFPPCIYFNSDFGD